MQWDAFVNGLSHPDRARLIRALDEARLYGSLPARATDRTDVEWIVSCIDRALDALAAARILLGAPVEPQPWADDAYRAYRSHRPETVLRIHPTQLDALRQAVHDNAMAAGGVRAEMATGTA
jgi:hypothetical protein